MAISRRKAGMRGCLFAIFPKYTGLLILPKRIKEKI